MSYNLKSILEDFKKKGIFYTPPELAEFVKNLVDVEYTEVYDPTCGDGGLLAPFPPEIPKFGQEINADQLEVARDSLDNFTGYCGDTLTDPFFINRKFSLIVANPPFSVAWSPPAEYLGHTVLPPKSKADYAFILHILHCLADNGQAIVIEFPGILYRGNSEGKIRKMLVEQNLIEKVIHIPGDTFTDTKIATVCLIFRKNKQTTDIEFIDSEKGKSRIVPIQEVLDNDCNLSVLSYIIEEVQREFVDPYEVNQRLRTNCVEILKRQIENDKFICDTEGWDHSEFIESIRQNLPLNTKKKR